MLDYNGHLTNTPKEINTVKFNLASDTYGAKYYVKLCFWGTEVDTSNMHSIFGLHVATNYIDDADDYTEDSGLTTAFEIDCDGTDFDHQIGNPQFQDLTGYSSSNNLQLAPGPGNSGGPIKMCWVKFHYMETMTLKLRPHALQMSEIQIWARVFQDYSVPYGID